MPVSGPDYDNWRKAALAVVEAIDVLRTFEETRGHDAYLLGQAREVIGRRHIDYLKKTGELSEAARLRELLAGVHGTALGGLNVDERGALEHIVTTVRQPVCVYCGKPVTDGSDEHEKCMHESIALETRT